jgi:hypothetical protein
MDINNIYFYLLLGVFLYFLFTYVLENYLVEQENFDPSLVPVSSIVTLAKVAQKLVNGNGTLTNPGNLQIGKDMQATGALTVTGKTAIGSTTIGDKTLNVTGTVGVSGDTNVGGNTTVGGKLDVTGNTTLGGLYTKFSNGSTFPYSIIRNPTNLTFVGGKTDNTDYNWSNTVSIDNNANMTIGGTTPTTLNTGNGELTVKGMSNLSDITATGNIILSTNPAANGVSIGTETLPSGVGGLAVAGNTTVGGALGVTGNLNARTVEGYNTRVGGIWTSGGIYAEGTSNLEIGAGSTNVYIGAANNTAKNNLKVTGTSHDSADPIMLANYHHRSYCLSGDGTNIISKSCNRNDITQFWKYTGVRFVHINSGKCMTITANSESYDQPGVTKFGLAPCDIKNGDQVLRWNQASRRIHRWKNNFTNHSDHWVTQVRLQGNGTLDLWNDKCENDCVWDAF